MILNTWRFINPFQFTHKFHEMFYNFRKISSPTTVVSSDCFRGFEGLSMSSVLFFRFHHNYYRRNSCYFSFVVGFPSNILMIFCCFLMTSSAVLSSDFHFSTCFPSFIQSHASARPIFSQAFSDPCLFSTHVWFFWKFYFWSCFNHPRVMLWYGNCLHPWKCWSLISVGSIFLPKDMCSWSA